MACNMGKDRERSLIPLHNFKKLLKWYKNTQGDHVYIFG